VWSGLPLLWTLTLILAALAYVFLVLLRDEASTSANSNVTDKLFDAGGTIGAKEADYRGTDRTFRWNNSLLNVAVDHKGWVQIVLVENLNDISTRRRWEVDIGGTPERTALLTAQRPEILALVGSTSHFSSLIGVSGLEGNDGLIVTQLLPLQEIKSIGRIVDFEVTPDEESVVVLLEANSAPGVASLFAFSLDELRAESAFHCPAKLLSSRTFALDRPVDLAVGEINGNLSIGFGPGREEGAIEIDLKAAKSVNLAEMASTCGPSDTELRRQR